MNTYREDGKGCDWSMSPSKFPPPIIATAFVVNCGAVLSVVDGTEREERILLAVSHEMDTIHQLG